jgi:hypothetical protein
MPGPKPLYKKNRLVVLKRALPGAPANTPMLIVGVRKGSKREGHLNRYEVVDNTGIHYYVYESDLG